MKTDAHSDRSENFNDNTRSNYGTKGKQGFSPNKYNTKRKNFHLQGRYYHNSFNDLYNSGGNIDDNNSPNRKRKKEAIHQEEINSSLIANKIKKKSGGRRRRFCKNLIPLEVKSLPRFQSEEVSSSNCEQPVTSGGTSNVNNSDLCRRDKQVKMSSPFVESSGKKDSRKKNEKLSIDMNATETFKSLLHPVAPGDFNLNYWEKSPLYIERASPDYYSQLNVTTDTVDTLLRNNHVLFTKNIDITTYTDGVRETHNPVGRAQAHIVWDFFKNGCSVRLLNPQTFIDTVYRLNESLQNYFNGFVGANLYLTPPNSQGFAPHYDDIEAFVLQLQGCKYWKIYKPRMESEELPRYSSPNFTEDEVGEPLLEVVLRPGDLLYFPRGFIHQASTRDDLSLHITLSAYQCSAYVDLLEKLLPDALNKAAKEEVQLRKGLPLDFSSQFGLALSKGSRKERRKFYTNKVVSLVKKVLTHLDIDSAMDKLAAKSLHDQLPPYFTENEKKTTVFTNGTKLNSDCKTVKVIQLQLSTHVRLVNPKLCRLVKNEDGKFLLYHSINNSMEYHGNDEEFLEVPEESVDAFKKLCLIFPGYIRVKKLPLADNEAKWSFANSLWEIGLLRTRQPLEGIVTDFAGNDEEPDENEAEEDNSDENDDEIADDDVNDDNDYNFITIDDRSVNDGTGLIQEESSVNHLHKSNSIEANVENSGGHGERKSDSDRDDVVIVE